MNAVEHMAWDRLPHESSKAYAAFSVYLRLGVGRSLHKTAKDGECAVKSRQLEKWSSRWTWVDRSAQYDEYLKREERIRHEKNLFEMKERHSKLATMSLNLIQDSLIKKLKRISNQEAIPGSKVEEMSFIEMTRLLDIAVKVERLSRGEKTEEDNINDPLVQLVNQMRQIHSSMPINPELVPPKA